ncbi:DNA replication complex GINS protein PSF2 [Cichlidogyrus casuarinus]|uniref:DNA replication complex GINS protein PSF2 n=1 Tax=Cichlidogyrus casuarinus TaxID=1844966 RepID=A0ABD2QHC7_9PLAT
MDPPRIDFLAEETIITVVPRFKHAAIELFGKSIGPFYPNTPINLPLWLALNLRSQQKCRIIAPDWCNVAFLSQLKEEEEGSDACKEPPHVHYAEITALLFENAADDIASIEAIRTLVKDLWDIRVSKLVNSANSFLVSDATTAKVSHLTALELSSIHDIFTTCVDQIAKLRSLEDIRSSQVDQSSSTFSRSYLSST